MKKNTLRLIFLIFVFGFNLKRGQAQATVSLENTTFYTCGNTLPSTTLNLGDVVFTETLVDDIAIGIYTFTIDAPTNFTIDASVITFTGTDISSATVQQLSGDPTKLEVTLEAVDQMTTDAVTIENVKITKIGVATTTDGNVTYNVGANPNGLNGLTDAQNLATVGFTSLVAGTGQNQEVCSIAAVQNISVLGSNVTQSRTYEWQKEDGGSWVTISGATDEIYIVDHVTFPNGVSKYRRITTFTVNGEACTLTSTAATITVNDIYAGTITAGNNQSICSGDTPTQLSAAGDVATTPGGTSTYQWYKNDIGTWEEITGATENTYQPEAITNTTSYKRRITNVLNGFSCFNETPPITVSVNSLVQGGTTTDQNICEIGDLQLITVNSGETSGTYQWQKRTNADWEDISGATNSSFNATTNVQAGTQEYRRVTSVSGAGCQGISTVATVVYTNFVGGSISGDDTICNGDVPDAITSTSNASGTGTITYQWEQNTTGTWSSISGATTTDYQPSALSTTTSYRRQDNITLNGFTCNEVTNAVTITVLDVVSGGTASADQTLCAATVPVTISITGGTAATAGITYQWQSATTGAFTNISGETDASLSFASAPSVTTKYRRHTTSTSNSTLCDEYSTESTVYVNTITAGVIGDNQTLCAGVAPSTIISLSSTVAQGTITYQWESSTDGTTWVPISGATGTTYNPSTITATTRYKRLDTSTLNGQTCTVNTNIVVITISGAINGGTASAAQAVCEDETPTTITITGATTGAAINYQWLSSTDDSTYTAIAGETGEDLNFGGPIAETTYYKRRITRTNGGNTCTDESTSSLITLISLDEGSIGSTHTICGFDASPLTSTADATSNGTLTYLWQASEDGTIWNDIAGTNQATYTPTGLSAVKNYFRRKVQTSLLGETCEKYSNPVIVYLNKFDDTNTHQITFGTGSAGSTTICNEGDPLPFVDSELLLASGVLTYQWQSSLDNISFTNISGATNLSYDPPIVTADIHYRRINMSVLNGVTCMHISNVLSLINGGDADAGTVGTTNPNGTDGDRQEVICRGEDPSEIEKKSDASGSGDISYQWFANGALITGATEEDYDPPTGLMETTFYVRTTYSSDISGVTCNVDSNAVEVLVPQADELGPDITICSGELVGTLGDVSLIEGIDYLTFQWYQSNDGSTFTTIAGATNATYTPNPSSGFTNDIYYRRGFITTIDAVVCGPEEYSNTIHITINDVDGGSILGNQQICFAEDPDELTNNVDGSADGVLAYQWFSSEDGTSWALIDGAVNSTFNPEASSNPTTYYKRTTSSTLNNVACTADSNVITVAVAEEVIAGTLNSDQTVCLEQVPASLTVTGGSTFSDQIFDWYSSTDGIVWTDLSVNTASYSPSALTKTTHYKRTITRTSLASLTCVVETEPITIFVNAVNAGEIEDNQSVCEGSLPDTLVELIGGSGVGTITYKWLSSPNNQIYSEVPGATEANYGPPSTLTTSTYFKRQVISTLNGVACSDETSPKLITVIPYPIIDEETIVAQDITSVSCNGGDDGSILITNSRITGGNSAQKQINTITLLGTPELGNTYSIIIDGKVYEHDVILSGANPQSNDEIATALTDAVNNATGADVSTTIALNNTNEIVLTAKTAGIGFQAFISTGSGTSASATNVITQANNVANTYSWTKIGDTDFSASTLSISDLTAGNYILTVTNQFCSVDSRAFAVTEPDELDLTIGDTCNTAISATSTGGVAPFTYTLTKPDGSTVVETTNDTEVTYTGLIGSATYSLKVQDAVCSRQVIKTTTLPLGLVFDAASVNVTNVTCFGQNDGAISLNNGSTTVTGGFPPYTFSWSGPDGVSFSTQNISGLAPGVYVLAVSDQAGCSTGYTVNIASKSELSFSNTQIINEKLACAGDTNGEISVQISADETSNIQVNWFKNGTSFTTNSTSISGLGIGVYEVVATDINSDPDAPCVISHTFNITGPSVFSATEVEAANATCYDPAVGRTFTFSVAGGTLPYQYIVDGGTPESFTTLQTTIRDLSNNSHVITVTDSNSCVVETFLMDRFDPLNYSGTKDFTIAACTNETSFTLDDSLVSGGTPFLDANSAPYYLYTWTGPNNFKAQDITSFNAEAGTYTLTITDSNDCTSEEIDFNFEPTYPPITVTKTITPVSCGATNDGALAIVIAGGLRPYTILWEKETAGSTDSPNATFTTMANNVTELSGLEEGRIRITVSSSIPNCNNDEAAYYYQEIITIPKTESLQLVDGPYLDEALCAGNPGTITVDIFNNQDGDLSFYYNNALVPSVKNTTSNYSVQIGTPTEDATLNVLNNLGCGLTMQLLSGVTDPTFSYSSEEFKITGLLLAKEEVRFTNTSETGYGNATWNFGDGSATVTLNPNEDGVLATHSYDFPGIFDVTLELFNEQGCSKTITQSVTVGNGYDVMFPDVFSANGDSINDYFQGEFTGISSFTFEIYDMWGSLVYSVAHDFNDLPPNWGWNGEYSTGKPYSGKSFRYVFIGTTRTNTQITRTGEATILR